MEVRSIRKCNGKEPDHQISKLAVSEKNSGQFHEEFEQYCQTYQQFFQQCSGRIDRNTTPLDERIEIEWTCFSNSNLMSSLEKG